MRTCFSILIILTGILYGQDIPADSAYNYSLFSIKPKYLLFEDDKNIFQFGLQLHYQPLSLDKMHFKTRPRMSSLQMGIDTRSSSYYTPRIVRDEMNMIMNRPKDQAFAPVMGVAYLAYQLASKYIFFKDRLEIQPHDVLLCKDQIDIIVALWDNSPQTIDQLYKLNQFQNKYTYLELEKAIEKLADHNLIKTKNIENDEIQYFPAAGRSELDNTLEKGKIDTLTSQIEIYQIDSLQIYFRQSAN